MAFNVIEGYPRICNDIQWQLRVFNDAIMRFDDIYICSLTKAKREIVPEGAKGKIIAAPFSKFDASAFLFPFRIKVVQSVTHNNREKEAAFRRPLAKAPEHRDGTKNKTKMDKSNKFDAHNFSEQGIPKPERHFVPSKESNDGGQSQPIIGLDNVKRDQDARNAPEVTLF